MSRWHQHDWDLLPKQAFRGTPNNKFAQQPTREGGKGSDAPPPDPRLIEAQIRSLDKQGLALDKIMANSERLLPLQEEQLRFALDSNRTAFSQAQDDREWMVGRRGALSGLQDQLVSDARSFNTEDRRQQLAGEAVGDVTQAFDSARQQGLRGMARMGVNPNDGRFAAFNNQANSAQALAQATAANKVRQAARMEGMAMTDRATNALAGYPAMGMQATGAMAGYGAQGMNIANTGLAGMNSGYGAAGGVAGQMGANATNMYGAQANYKVNADRAAADSDPFGALLGAGAQLGAAAIKWSDRRLKENIERVGEHTNLEQGWTLTLYEFSYLGEARRWRGVMADEVRAVRPDAVTQDARGFDMVDYGALGLQMEEVA